jgi:hypothetical protein
MLGTFMRVHGRLAGTALAVAATLVAAAQPADAAAPPPCPGPVTANLKLTGNLTCNLEVRANGVAIDLAGYTVTGHIMGPSRSDVRVTGGTVVGELFFEGAARLRLDHLTIRGSEGFAVEPGRDAQITDNRFEGNSVAVDNYFDGGRNLIATNRFTGNAIGVLVGADSGLTVRDNIFENNDTAVKLWDEDTHGSSANQIYANRFTANGVGVRLEFRCDTAETSTFPCTGAMAGNVIRGNRIERSRSSGILVTGSCAAAPGPTTCAGWGTRIQDNQLLGNGTAPPAPAPGAPTADDGITFVGTAASAKGVILRGNVARGNADLGFEVPGVTDEGRNQATTNGDRRQCLGVRCG